MVVCCIALGVCSLWCLCWGCRRCMLSGLSASKDWLPADVDEFQDVPRICRVLLAVYEQDLQHPLYADVVPEQIVKRVGYEETQGRCPPYIIYVDHEAKDICLAVRGLNMANCHDYMVLMDRHAVNVDKTAAAAAGGKKKGGEEQGAAEKDEKDGEGRLEEEGSQKEKRGLQRTMAMLKNGQVEREEKFDGGYVHHGLLRSAAWLLDREFEPLMLLCEKYGDYSLTLTGHSLGSGVVAIAAVLLTHYADQVDGGNSAWRRQLAGLVEGNRLRCFAIAPARSTSMNLAVRYADIINSVVLQDDFLPRTSAPIQGIFGSALCLPCVLCFSCCYDSCVPRKARLHNPRRLYVPGRLYHVVYTKDFSCAELTPQVKTAVPVDDFRFETLILSRTTTADHSLVNILDKCSKAVEAMREGTEEEKEVPPEQKMERQATLRKERLDEVYAALERAQSIHVPNAKDPNDLFVDSFTHEREAPSDFPHAGEGETATSQPKLSRRWQRLIERLLEKEQDVQIDERDLSRHSRVQRNWMKAVNAAMDGNS